MASEWERDCERMNWLSFRSLLVSGLSKPPTMAIRDWIDEKIAEDSKNHAEYPAVMSEFRRRAAERAAAKRSKRKRPGRAKPSK